MAWNGSGLFTRIYNWVNDRDASIPITASRMDEEMDGMAVGITNCVTKDGQNSPSADLPMANFKHTGVGNSTSRNNYPATGQVQDGAFNYSVDTGVADAYVISPSPAITAYAAGQVFRFKAVNANTGASTLAVSGLSAKSIKNYTGALGSGDIKANEIITVVYDGAEFKSIFIDDAATRSVGTGAADLPDTAQLDVRLGTSGNLGDAALATLGADPAEVPTNADLGSASVEAYTEQDVVINSGDFSGNSFTLKCRKIGKIVTLHTPAVSHASDSIAISAAGALPAAFRPDTNANNVFYASSDGVYIFVVESDGKVSITYRNWSGTLFNRTSSLVGINVAYSI